MAAEISSSTVFVTLGSNIEPRTNLERALEVLGRELHVVAASGFWESDPYGAPGTPRFLNAAVRIATVLAPLELKRLLRRIEAELGRRRDADRNAPRTIDLDLALFGDLVIDDPAAGLRVPDPDVERRAYLALPLAEIGPDVAHPQTGELLAEIAARLSAECAEPPHRIGPEPGSAPAAGS